MNTSRGERVFEFVIGQIVGTRRPNPQTPVHHECRWCGTTVSETADVCPECGKREVARIELR